MSAGVCGILAVLAVLGVLCIAGALATDIEIRIDDDDL